MLVARPGAGEDVVELMLSNREEQAEDPEQEAEVADAVDDEGLDRRGIGLGLRR